MNPEDVAQMLFDDFNNRTYRQNSANYIAPNAVLRDDPTGQELYGPEGNIAYSDMWSSAFPDAMVEITDVQADDNTVTIEFVGRGTFTGQLPAPDGSMIQGSGQTLDLPYTTVAEIEDGKIVRFTNYYDINEMMRQLGLG